MISTQVYFGDSREILKKFPDGHFDLIITSPPYADARVSHYDSIKPDQYVDFMLTFHKELWRTLSINGSFVLNVKDKVVRGIRHRFVWETIESFADLGWLCIDDYIWVKPNAMPGYWPNRLRDEWEYCFHLTKRKEFKMYQTAVRRPIGTWAATRLKVLKGKSNSRHDSENHSGFGRDLRNWKQKDWVLPGNALHIPLVGRNHRHPAAFPVGVPEFFIKLFTSKGDRVLDPFAGSGSTGIAAEALGRNVVLIDNKREYVDVMWDRLARTRSASRRELFIGTEPTYKDNKRQRISIENYHL
ncbi:MAG: site-specific DNA-methyltransferase [Nitrososphaerota archaeon]|nr:site-specific DNA-methyltransferase [Nitrososphaerota archaeon]